jgi:hypothetical protein
MIGAALEIRSGGTARRVLLTDYLDAEGEERAHEAAYGWIKALRRIEFDGAPMRDRFTARGDSLWWFTELYLHKTAVVLDIFRWVHALNRLIDREAPRQIAVEAGAVAVEHLATRIAAARGISATGGVRSVTWLKRLAQLDLRARRLHLAALAAPERRRGDVPHGPVDAAAFVHRAFWRSGGHGSAESYIGGILAELEGRLGPKAVHYVGVGPTVNFRAARSRRRRREVGEVTAVERFAPLRTLEASRRVWRQRYEHFRALTRNAAIRDAAHIGGADCWPLVREQLAGVAWLQWPWSVRAMDEAAAALDALQPGVAVTYAEAGGWGRALVLESRRRNIPSVGIQHGFIYRHWLNYLHEPDEMTPGGTPAFPAPTRTLLFDRYAARHLSAQGRFPDDSLRVTGSARLDELAAEVAALPGDSAQFLRQDLRVGPSATMVLLATKEKEARAHLPAFIEAAARIEGAVVVVKPHPAETAESYREFQTREHVRIVAPHTSLAVLLAASRAIVTINSTVALDAGVFGVPALSIGLPNNLSPFVDLGVIAGAVEPADIEALLRRILYDEGFRRQFAERRRTVFGDSPLPGTAAARAGDAILELIRR